MADLTPPVEREPTQSRSIACSGYARADGLWDIEAHLLDTKPLPIDYPRYGVPKPAGHPVHEMKVRITIDGEMRIHAAEAVTLHAPFAACTVPAAAFPRLRGLSFNEGWRQRVMHIMGGTAGCTHLRELLSVLATFSYQTIASSEEYIQRIEAGHKPFFLGKCHTYDEQGEVVRRFYPEFYRQREDAAGAGWAGPSIPEEDAAG